jgi:hypothetical protein
MINIDWFKVWNVVLLAWAFFLVYSMTKGRDRALSHVKDYSEALKVSREREAALEATLWSKKEDIDWKAMVKAEKNVKHKVAMINNEVKLVNEKYDELAIRAAIKITKLKKQKRQLSLELADNLLNK